MTETRKDPQVPDLPFDVMELQMGPSHPAVHGIVKLLTKVSGETILDMDVEIGYLHRAFEKMCEHRNWNQNIVFTDRLNYCSAPANNAAYVSAVEKLCKFEIPERAKWVRLIVTELARVADHLTCVAASVMELGAFSVYLYYIQGRELLWFVLDKICGSRLTTSMSRIGGQAYDLYDGFDKDIAEAFAKIRQHLEDGHKLVTRNRIFYDRLRNTGKVSQEMALDWSFTGPMLRSTGIAYDVRKAKPHWTYDQVQFEVPVGDHGDNYDRYLIRMEEMEQSMRIIEQALAKIPEGDVFVNDYKFFLPPKYHVYNSIDSLIHHFEIVMHGPPVPAGEAYFAIESPNGEHGYYVVSDGTGMPYRVRARPTCLPFTMAMPDLCKGAMIADIIPTFGSINMIGGELER
ncbi:MAG: NADH-quinone oxidoreductase subunit D [Myxococcales bacterium]|nr:MAG: NADH-quinone oxidoreductase subunit D [Myxococcales bacterium]